MASADHPVDAPGTGAALLDRLLSVRDRLVASPRFRHWAARFPLTRPVARRRARALFDLCAGFVYSQVLLACVRLKLFDILAEGPQTPEALAPRLDLPLDSTTTLLRAAAALRLAEARSGGRYGLGPLGAAMLGNDGLAAMVEHHGLLYADLADPVALLKAGRTRTGLGGFWPYAAAEQPAGLDRGTVTAYTALMAASQPMVAAEVLGAYPVRRHRCILDIGGGNGTFLMQVAQRAPDLKLMLFDLPAVAEQARERFAAAGLSARATVVGGSFRSDPLPTGADLVTLVRIVHDHDDATVLALFRAIAEALGPDGTLLIAEPMSGTAGAEPVGDAYFGLYLMAMGSGRPRTPAELEALLRQAGFAHIEMARTSTPLVASVLVARLGRTG
ncbi:methyltransferase [Rhodocista pekingensis]|uniref:Methyltransferase n=1 Tax=Rhodocista pekingensis TaxID=201185 RepID=A0ABW2KX14_9PROT